MLSNGQIPYRSEAARVSLDAAAAPDARPGTGAALSGGAWEGRGTARRPLEQACPEACKPAGRSGAASFTLPPSQKLFPLEQFLLKANYRSIE